MFPPLASARLTVDSFDAVVMSHSLEHVSEPRADLARVRRLLRPGGLLLISVPNFASWQREMFGSEWFALDLPRHRTHFTPRSLAHALRGEGFELVSVRTTSSSGVLVATLQYVLADYMADSSVYLSLAAFYQKKRDFFLSGLAGSRFRVLPSRGTFFQNLAYDAISDEKDTNLAVRLTKERGLASIPLSVFYHDGHCDKVLRFCFAKSEQTLAKGAAILRCL